MTPGPAPTVTVGISFYNNRETLAEAITSVLNQTFTDWELVLTDDGSRDGSGEVARRFTDPRIRLVDDGTNQGLCARLNQQVALARGRYFARMDADDLMHPERLAKQVAHLEAHPDDDLVDTNMYSLDETGRLVAQRKRRAEALRLPDVLRGHTPLHATVMGRLAWFRRFPYDPAYVRAEDLELWARSVTSSRFAHLDEALYFVREGRVNVQSYVRSQATCIRIYQRYGPAGLGRVDTLGLCLKARLKSLTYRAFGLFAAQDRLVARRNTPLGEAERAGAQAALDRARTPWPTRPSSP